MTGNATQADVITKAEAREMITEVFKETALVLGGLIAIHGVEDDLVWRFVKSLDAVHSKAIRRIDQRDAASGVASTESECRLRPHPAIEDFLLTLRRA